MSSDEYRFWSKVQQQPEGCWEWAAGRNHLGYGVFTIGRKRIKAHRAAYQFDNGPIPEGIDIDHICRNRGCVKPAHLRPVTAKQNAENLSGAHGHNVTSGVRGVYKERDKWRARVTHNGKIYTAGVHATIAEAEAAVIALRNQLFTHNNLDRQQQGS